MSLESADILVVSVLAFSILFYGLYFGALIRNVPKSHNQKRSDCVRIFLTSTKSGVYLEVQDSLISLLASITYVASTYSQVAESSASMYLFCADSIFTIFFSFNFLLQFYIARNRFKYFFTVEAVIDEITIVPMIVIICSRGYPNNSSYTNFFRVARLLKVARVFRLFRLLRTSQVALRETKIEDAVTSQIIDTCAKFLCLIFITSGLTQALDQHMHGAWANDGSELQFHDALYFIIITLSTVGYGDISPSTAWGRLFVCVTVFAFIFFLPTESNRISRLLSLRSKFSGSLPEVYYGRQLIIGCNPNCCVAVETLLQEIFHEDHGLRTEHAVILCPCEPDLEWGSLLLQYASRDKLSFLRGDVQTPGDLERAGVQYAKSIFILSDRNATDTRIEDTRTLMRVLTAQECNRETPIFAQVIHKDTRDRVLSLGLDSKHVICMEEINTIMLASACLWHGWPLLVSNLLTCCVPPSREVSAHQSPSVREYMQGMAKEVYKLRTLGSKFQGATFASVAQVLYSTHGAHLFAAVREGRVLLFPGRRFLIEYADEGFIIADDVSVVDNIGATNHKLSLMKKKGSLWATHSRTTPHPVSSPTIDFPSIDLSFAGVSRNRSPEMKSKDFDPAISNGFNIKGHTANSNVLKAPPIRRQQVPAKHRSLSSEKGSISDSNTGRQSDLRNSISDSKTGIPEDLKLMPPLVRKLSCRPKVSTNMSVNLKPRSKRKRLSTINNDCIDCGHIVLIVHELSGSLPIFVEFIHSKHFYHLIGPKQVVVICPSLSIIPPKLQQFCDTHRVVLIKAEPNAEGMAKAKVKYASVVVITNSGNLSFSNSLSVGKEKSQALANTETLSILVELLAYAGSATRFVIELSDSDYLNHVGILGLRVAEASKSAEDSRQASPSPSIRRRSVLSVTSGTVKEKMYQAMSSARNVTDTFGVLQIGAGDVVLSNVSELLLAQTFFNENIVDVVGALLSYTKYGESLICPCQIQVPRTFHDSKSTAKDFATLFTYVLEVYDALAVGVYRVEQHEDGSEGFMVITCPSPDFIIRPTDEVFAFCNVYDLEDKPEQFEESESKNGMESFFKANVFDDSDSGSESSKSFAPMRRSSCIFPNASIEALNERQNLMETQLQSFMHEMRDQMKTIQNLLEGLQTSQNT